MIHAKLFRLLVVPVAVAFAFLVPQQAISAVQDHPTPATPYPDGKWQPGPPQYGVTTQSGVPVMMNDGVVLYADIAYPTDLKTGQRAPGKFPVIVEHTPYIDALNPLDTYFTQHGYISVKVCARGGCGNSGGDIAYYGTRDGLDGKAIINWAANIPGANGKVGQFGCSYPGGIALDDAAFVGPSSPLKATVAQCTGLDVFNRGIAPGGIPAQDVAAQGGLGPYLGGTAAQDKYFQNLEANILGGGNDAYDRAYWKQRFPLSWAAKIVKNNVPVLLWSGWNDIYSQSAMQAYAAMQNAYQGRVTDAPMSPNQPTTPRYQIIQGNWSHGGGLDDGIALEWFDTWIKRINTGLESTKTPMHLFEEGTNRYINAAIYPVTNDYRPYFLNSGDVLTHKPQNGNSAQTLTWTQPTAADGQLTYTTPPLTRGATLAGPISTTVYVASSNTNVELIAKLYDIGPGGTATQITKGDILGSQRKLDPMKSWTDQDGRPIRPWTIQTGDDYLTPGGAYRLQVNLLPVQWGLLPGHQLQLQLTTQSPPSVCALPLGTDPCVLTPQQLGTVPGGTYTILHGSKWPSLVNLPLLPADLFPTAASGATPTSNGVIEPLDWSGSLVNAQHRW
jgi:predicted acyl esterase